MATFTEYLPHPAQVAIHRAKDKRFRTVCTGRRFGKTLCLAGELLDWGRRYGGEYGWVAPTYNVAERGIEAFRSVACEVVQVCGRAPSRVEFTGKAGPVRIWFLSADNADAIRGYGFQGLVIDEAASIPVDVWNYVLRPTISQTLGWAIFVSTPKGRNWFYDMFTRGQDPNERDYASFRFASNASPFFPQAEWEEARRTLPEDVFRQEYMAEFLEDSAGVFRGIDACLYDAGKGDRSQESEYRRSVVIGCDLAKHTDWTVLVAMDATTGRCFAMERFNHLEWPIQKERIVAFARRWHGRVILDATGVGDPIYDDLKRVLPDIEPFVVTVGSKVEVVQRLVVAIEQRQVSWPAGSAGRVGGGAAGGVGGGVGGGLGGGECGGFRGAGVTDRAVKVVRDVGPSAALSRDDATTRLASPAPSGGQADLTRDFAVEKPVRDTGGHRAEYGASVGRAGGGECGGYGGGAGRGEELSADCADGRRWDGGDWGVLTAELRRFEYEIGAGGRISYGAPSGYHDDCVMALALANHGRWQRSGMGTMVVLGVGDTRWGWRRHRVRREGRGENRAI